VTCTSDVRSGRIRENAFQAVRFHFHVIARLVDASLVNGQCICLLCDTEYSLKSYSCSARNTPSTQRGITFIIFYSDTLIYVELHVSV
jgi:hypothetical protein